MTDPVINESSGTDGAKGPSGPPAEAMPRPKPTATAESASDTTSTSAAPKPQSSRSTGTGSSDDAPQSDSGGGTNPDGTPKARRRRGSRGGRGRGGGGGSPREDGNEQGATGSPRSASSAAPGDGAPRGDRGPKAAAGVSDGDAPSGPRPPKPRPAAKPTDVAADDGGIDRRPDELPERSFEGKPRTVEAADKALVRKPRIGDTRPAPASDDVQAPATAGDDGDATKPKSRRRRGGRGRGGSGSAGGGGQGSNDGGARSKGGGSGGGGGGRSKSQDSRGRSGPASQPVQAVLASGSVELDEEEFERRRGRSRNGRPVGRYLMTVSVQAQATQIAVLEGRNLIEHYVSRPADDVAQIHGNVYLGRVQNVLPGMEAAFVDIGTPKNAVLYRGDVQYEAEDIEEKGANPRIEQILKAKQTIICQVTKNPIAHKGARLTQEVSLPGRFVVLIPNSSTYGISKRLPDDERKRLRSILDKVKPAQHGLIVRTAAEGVTDSEIQADVIRLLQQWERIEELAKSAPPASLLYREPDMAVRVIREEFNDDYRGVVIDDKQLFEEIHGYVSAISPALADRVQYYDKEVEPLPISERHHVHEQLHKALDRKVWLPSGGSLIIEHTEALTVIDVNTGKNVGTSSLEETVFRNNLEAAIEIAKQLRLRDIGGIIVIDFIDMEIRKNRDEVIRVFRDSLARDKTRTQVFDISELGLVEMTRKRIGEGLLESFSTLCPDCEGRGLIIDKALLD